MMNKSSQQRTKYIPQGTERGELLIITEKRVIRRICLNNEIIPMEVDLSSLVSAVISNRLEENRILEIVRRTEIKALGHGHSADSACDIKKLNEIHQERRPNPNITTLSDDPRRGGRRGQLEVPAPDKDNKGKPPMESSETMSTDLSKMQGEEETNESDSEFHDAVSDIREFDEKTDPEDVGQTDDAKTNKDATSDSGFDEEEECFELAAEEPNSEATVKDGANDDSSEKDEDSIDSSDDRNDSDSSKISVKKTPVP